MRLAYVSPDPIIWGDNLYAPCAVDVNGEWYVYVGGWKSNKDKVDRIYLTTIPPGPPRLINFGFHSIGRTAPSLRRVYGLNDISVVRRGPGDWWMAATAVYNPSAPEVGCGLVCSTSADGITWTQLQRIEVHCPPGMAIISSARPSLVWNVNAWRLYFEAKLQESTLCVAVSSLNDPENLVDVDLVTNRAAPVPWYDVEVKMLEGRWHCLYRKNEIPEFPWNIWEGVSDDGVTFSEVGRVLTPGADMSWCAAGVVTPGMMVDRFGILRAVLFGGARDQTVEGQKVGMAVVS